jgi:bifunctional non-homologous end joining protein LigD
MPRAPRRGTTTETTPARPGSPPAFVEPQLAQLVKSAPDGDDWLHELKFDGYRILARLDGGKATLLSRRGLDWTASFPTVRAAIEQLAARSAIVDTEVAVVLPDGRTSFQALQNAFGATAPRGLACFAFDLLFVDGVDLRARPLEARKERLKSLLAASPESIVRYSDHVVGRGGDFFRTACGRGLEGIISKRRDLPYQAGRGNGWVKTKCTLRQELVIAGFTDPEGSRTGIGALLLGYYEGSALQYAGKCGTGFTQKVLVDLRKRLAPLEQAACPFAVQPPRTWTGSGVHWARPHLVAEIEFSEWTDDGRMRHPSFQGLRKDKSAREVVREAPRAIDPPR